MSNNSKQNISSVISGFFHPVCFIAFVLLTFSSCSSVRPTAYFETIKRDTSINQFLSKNMESKIVQNDVLAITVSSLNKAEDALYNGSSISNSANSGANSEASSQSTSPGQGYTVDLQGNIQMHN